MKSHFAVLLGSATWIASLGSASIGLGQFQLDIDQVADQAFPQFEDADPTAVDKLQGLVHPRAGVDMERNLNAVLFNRFGDELAARKQLEHQLTLAVAAIDRACQLTEAQREKLHVAGQGDVAIFFADVEAIREEFRGQADQNVVNAMWQRVQPLQQRLQSHMFDRRSLLWKVARTTLDAEQRERFHAHEQTRDRFAYQAAMKMTIANFEKITPLTSVQRAAVLELLATTPPPKVLGPYNSYYVMYQLANIREQLGEILDARKLEAMGQLFAQGHGMEAFLRQNGYLD